MQKQAVIAPLRYNRGLVRRQMSKPEAKQVMRVLKITLLELIAIRTYITHVSALRILPLFLKQMESSLILRCELLRMRLSLWMYQLHRIAHHHPHEKSERCLITRLLPPLDSSSAEFSSCKCIRGAPRNRYNAQGHSTQRVCVLLECYSRFLSSCLLTRLCRICR